MDPQHGGGDVSDRTPCTPSISWHHHEATTSMSPLFSWISAQCSRRIGGKGNQDDSTNKCNCHQLPSTALWQMPHSYQEAVRHHTLQDLHANDCGLQSAICNGTSSAKVGCVRGRLDWWFGTIHALDGRLNADSKGTVTLSNRLYIHTLVRPRVAVFKLHFWESKYVPMAPSQKVTKWIDFAKGRSNCQWANSGRRPRNLKMKWMKSILAAGIFCWYLYRGCS